MILAGKHLLMVAVCCVCHVSLARAERLVSPAAGERQIAQKDQEPPRKAVDANQPKRMESSSAEQREAEAMAFVEQYHPELAQLLVHLKKRDKESYSKAVRQLQRDNRRLEEMRARDTARHDLELQLWQSASRIQLISARLSMRDDENLRQELARELGRRYDARLALARLERNRAEQRVDRLSELIGRLEANRQKAIERDLEKLLRKGGADK